MQVTIHAEAGIFEALQGEWNALVARSQNDRIFQRWEWHYHWWQAYCPGELFVLVVRDGERLVGLAPMFIEHYAPLGKRARIIGSHDVTDYMDVIADDELRQTVYQALAEAFAAQRARFDVLDFSNIPSESPTLTEFTAALQSAGFSTVVTQQEVCPLFALPQTFEAYLESLESKQRSELRRKMRRAEGSDAMAWYVVGAEHDLEAELKAFLGLMAASHPEKAAFLQNPQHVAFFNAFMPVAMANDWLQLNFETVDGERVAAYLNFDYHDEILVYNSGLAPDKFGSLSPGIVLLANNIAYAIDHKKRVFDFLRGNEAYKYQMGGKDTVVYNIQAS